MAVIQLECLPLPRDVARFSNCQRRMGSSSWKVNEAARRLRPILTFALDDPYCHLYYGAEPQAPSYFALERTFGGPIGRVVRFDSLSKIISAGMRVGFVSGPAKILDAIDSHVSRRSFPVCRILTRSSRHQTRYLHLVRSPKLLPTKCWKAGVTKAWKPILGPSLRFIEGNEIFLTTA